MFGETKYFTVLCTPLKKNKIFSQHKKKIEYVADLSDNRKKTHRRAPRFAFQYKIEKVVLSQYPGKAFFCAGGEPLDHPESISQGHKDYQQKRHLRLHAGGQKEGSRIEFLFLHKAPKQGCVHLGISPSFLFALLQDETILPLTL